MNGVVFQAARSSGDDIGSELPASFGVFDDNADLGDPGLDLLLRTADYDATIGALPSSVVTSVQLTGLEVGSIYELQIFFMDQRNSLSSPPNTCLTCADRFLTLTSGSDSVTLDADPGNTLAAPYGQYVIGIFTADSETQPFDLTGGIDFDPFFDAPVSNRQVNAWQLRIVPEPASAALLALGTSLLAFSRRHSAG